MQIQINYKGFPVTATAVKGEPMTWDEAGCEDELIDIDYGLMSNELYDAYEDDILDELWDEVLRQRMIEERV